CGEDTPSEGGGDVDMGGAIDIDAGAGGGGDTCAEYAACGGIGDCGGNVGLRLPPLPDTLPGCNGSTDFTFPSGDWCTNEVTVLIGAAEWCGPCRIESEALRDNLLEEFRDEPVRVVQVLTQNVMGQVADNVACDRWISDFYAVDGFGTSSFAQEGMFSLVTDPGELTQVYEFDGLPNTLIIDGDGIIAARLTGLEGTVDNPVEGLVRRVRAVLDAAE
ncbi:MAG: hypothetical protein AAGH15_12350, partial [Myxococcota bacterium]